MVIHIVAHQDTLTDDTAAAVAQDGALDGLEPERADGKPLREQTLAEALTPPAPTGPAITRPGQTWSGGCWVGR